LAAIRTIRSQQVAVTRARSSPAGVCDVGAPEATASLDQKAIPQLEKCLEKSRDWAMLTSGQGCAPLQLQLEQNTRVSSRTNCASFAGGIQDPIVAIWALATPLDLGMVPLNQLEMSQTKSWPRDMYRFAAKRWQFPRALFTPAAFWKAAMFSAGVHTRTQSPIRSYNSHSDPTPFILLPQGGQSRRATRFGRCAQQGQCTRRDARSRDCESGCAGSGHSRRR
jgi:hypothetical protein